LTPAQGEGGRSQNITGAAPEHNESSADHAAAPSPEDLADVELLKALPRERRDRLRRLMAGDLPEAAQQPAWDLLAALLGTAEKGADK